MAYILYSAKLALSAVLAFLGYASIAKYTVQARSTISSVLLSLLLLVPLIRPFACWHLITRIVAASVKNQHSATSDGHFTLLANILIPCILFDIGGDIVAIVGIVLLATIGDRTLINVSPYVFIGAFLWLLYGFAQLWHALDHFLSPSSNELK